MQEITFDELSTLKQPSASLRTALDKISAALGSVGDAGQQARSVVDELRVSLREMCIRDRRRLPRRRTALPRGPEGPRQRAREHEVAAGAGGDHH